MMTQFLFMTMRILALVGFAIATMSAPASAYGADMLEDVIAQEERTLLVMVHQPPNRYRPGEAYSSGYGNARGLAARERLARSIARKHNLEFVEAWPMPVLGIDCFVMKIREGASAEQIIIALEKNPRVKWAEQIELYNTSGKGTTIGDPLYPTSPVVREWNISRLHRSWTGSGVPIAVIDTQVDAAHPDLAGRVKITRNFAPQSPAKPEYHGTEVAGIIAANANNGIGSLGVAPDARIMALRACWQPGDSARSICTSLNLARAIQFAIEENAKIINLSLGGPPNRLLSELINSAVSRGIAVVAAYNPDLPRGGFPASHPRVIAVADNDTRIGKGFSAPGTDIPTTQPGGGWHFVSGSSYSAAHISGLLALSYERSRATRDPWRSLSSVSNTNRKIDISASFGR